MQSAMPLAMHTNRPVFPSPVYLVGSASHCAVLCCVCRQLQASPQQPRSVVQVRVCRPQPPAPHSIRGADLPW